METVKVKVVAPIVIGFAAILAVVWYKKRCRNKLPEDWKEVGVLSDLMCFPIKSCGVIKLQSTDCSNLGLKHDFLRDRQFVIIDSSGNFITARKYPKLVLVKPKVVNDELVLEAPEMPILKISRKSLSEAKNTVAKVWDVPIKSKDCGDEAAQWFSQYILNSSSGLRLAMHPLEEGLRKSREPKYVKDSETGMYPDQTSYNLINESSVDDLNNRTIDLIKPQNFRPNFVIKGAEPYEEDYWRWVKIGDVVFQVVRQCTRCVFTTIDPETGVKNISGEPLKTLKTYRNIGDPKHEEFTTSSPVMGIHLALRKPGVISLGDKVYIVK